MGLCIRHTASCVEPTQSSLQVLQTDSCSTCSVATFARPPLGLEHTHQFQHTLGRLFKHWHLAVLYQCECLV